MYLDNTQHFQFLMIQDTNLMVPSIETELDDNIIEDAKAFENFSFKLKQIKLKLIWINMAIINN